MELLKQIMDLSRPSHVYCIRIAAHGSPVGTREWVRLFLATSPLPRVRHVRCHHTRNGLLALFSRFAARFSINVLAGFFLLSFFLSIPLLMCHSSILRKRGAASSLSPVQSRVC
ncbi:MAG: hypothetical protein M0038_06085, partial [Pseudomonadota bacterium]|nr:hypothetical protein [Pseudomonadota bacterium]